MNFQEYYPVPLADQVLWLENFHAKLASHCDFLGIPPERYTPILQDAACLIHLQRAWLGSIRSFGPSCTSFIEAMQMGRGAMEMPVWTPPPMPEGVVLVEAGALRRIFAFVQVIKRTEGCTESIRADLGLLPRPDAAQHLVPRCQLSTEQGQACEIVKLRFFKYGHQGVWIESRRGGENAPWEYLAVTTSSPWFDKRPLLIPSQPEVREYRLRFWDKGEPNGDWTPVSRATVSP